MKDGDLYAIDEARERMDSTRSRKAAQQFLPFRFPRLRKYAVAPTGTSAAIRRTNGVCAYGSNNE